MKKIIALSILAILMCGCSLTKDLDNTPTKKVEALLNRYQTLDNSVLDDLNDVVNGDLSFDEGQRETYKDIIKSNYQKMTYEIKNAEEDGEEAIVTAEIEVINYTTILTDIKNYLKEFPEEFEENGEYSESKYNDYRLEQLKNAKEKVKFSAYFSTITLLNLHSECIISPHPAKLTQKAERSFQMAKHIGTQTVAFSDPPRFRSEAAVVGKKEG